MGKRIILNVFCILLLAGGAISCIEQKNTPAPELILTESTVTAEAQGGTYNVGYELKNPIEGVEFTFSGQPEWITELADKGSSLEIVVSANPEHSERSCEIEVFYGTAHAVLSVKQAALSANPAVTFSISAKASAEDQAQVAVSISIDGGDKNAVSEYGFIYVEGKNALENGTKVSYSFADKGESFTETISGLRPENISYSIYPYLKYSDGEEINGEPYEYVHYWKEITKVVDIDGNEYPVFFSGDRYWMGADLKVTKYNDGTGIPNITDNAEWVSTGNGAFCYYDNKAENAAIYGALYNFAAANSGKICPEGWSLPTSQEWKDLAVSQGGKENHDEYGDYFPALGVKFKTKEYWTDNKPGRNMFGFNGVPGGCRRMNDGLFNVMGEVAYYWSADVVDTDNVLVYYLRLYNFANAQLGKSGGFSIRCVRDRHTEE